MLMSPILSNRFLVAFGSGFLPFNFKWWSPLIFFSFAILNYGDNKVRRAADSLCAYRFRTEGERETGGKLLLGSEEGVQRFILPLT